MEIGEQKQYASPTPAYIYPGQAFDEIGSLSVLMPKFPRLAFDLAATPGSRDVINTLSRSIMQSGTTPYGE